jgi:uncharacterized protein (TIGR03067 family)
MATATRRPRPRKKAARTDGDRLQGIWNYVSGQRKAELLIAGDHFAVKFRNGEVYMGTYRLAPGRKLKRIDMKVEAGPDRHRGKMSLGIYRFEAGRLHWAPGEPGGERPGAFPGPEDRQRLYLVLEREIS